MEKIKKIYEEVNWNKIGTAAFYGYFAVNILMKAFAYDHGDPIYKYFFAFGLIFLGIKLVTTKYTLHEIIWAALIAGVGLVLSIITKSNTWLLLFATIIGMKNCSYRTLIKISLYIRVFCVLVLVIGATFGVYDIGYKTTPNASYVEVPVYSFALGEPNYAFLTVFLTLMLLVHYNYEKLNKWWFLGTSAVAVLFYELTFCRTGIIVFFFMWVLIIFEKCVKNKKVKVILALSVPVGALFSFCTMVLFNAGNSFMAMLNRYVSGRINIMSGYYRDQGLALFPRTQEFFYASYHGLIDNSYMFVLLYCGWIIALFSLALICKTLFRLYKQEHYKELVMLGTLALYGVLEQFVMNGFMNPFILLTAIMLYPNILEEKEEVCNETISDSASA